MGQILELSSPGFAQCLMPGWCVLWRWHQCCWVFHFWGQRWLKHCAPWPSPGVHEEMAHSDFWHLTTLCQTEKEASVGGHSGTKNGNSQAGWNLYFQFSFDKTVLYCLKSMTNTFTWQAFHTHIPKTFSRTQTPYLLPGKVTWHVVVALLGKYGFYIGCPSKWGVVVHQEGTAILAKKGKGKTGVITMSLNYRNCVQIQSHLRPEFLECQNVLYLICTSVSNAVTLHSRLRLNDIMVFSGANWTQEEAHTSHKLLNKGH